MYIEASLIVDGALEESAVFDIPDEFDPWLDSVKLDFTGTDNDVDVFVIEHNHPPTGDCSCVQYLVDHSPIWSSKNDV